MDKHDEILAKLDQEERGSMAQEENPSQKEEEPSSNDSSEEGLGENRPKENVSDKKDLEDEDVSKKEESSESSDSLKKELESYKKRSEDNRKFALSVKSSVDLAKKKLEELVENGDLEESVSQAILESLRYDGSREPASLSDVTKNNHPAKKNIFSPLYEVMTPELANQYMDVTEDADFHKKVRAFDRLTVELSIDEQKAILEKALSGNPSPMTVLKRVLKEGEEFLNQGYKDYLDKGGFRNFIHSFRLEKEELLKTIDKLKKKVKDYESNFEESSSFDYGGSSSFSSRDKGDSYLDKDAAILAKLDKEEARLRRTPHVS